MRAAAILGMLAGVVLLTSCTTLSDAERESSVPHRGVRIVPYPHTAQFSFGAGAHFARCRADACPSITTKTIAAIQAPETIAFTPAPSLPVLAEVAEQTSENGASAAAVVPPPRSTATAPVREERVVVQFSFGDAQLSAESKEALRKALPFARSAERIVISGRTDSIGTDEANQSIAFARALAVREFLRTALPDLPNVIAISARGNCCFIADNDSAQGRQKNRRVEVVFNVAQPTQIN